jgi:hypothetical protein
MIASQNGRTGVCKRFSGQFFLTQNTLFPILPQQKSKLLSNQTNTTHGMMIADVSAVRIDEERLSAG